MHEYSGDTCTIKITASEPVKGWVTEHLPIRTEIVEHDGLLEIGTEEIEVGMIPHRFVFEDMTTLTITYTTTPPVEAPNYYWIAWQPGNPMFGYEDGDVKFSTN